MQAVILAAGKGTRMGNLTRETPKSLLTVAGKSILAWKLEALPDVIDEVVIVVGYLGDVVKGALGTSFRGKKIFYATQNNPVGGTMDALRAAQSILHDTFLVMNGDDVHAKSDLEKIVAQQWALAVSETENLHSASKAVLQGNVIADIIEADQHGGGRGLAGVGAYVLDSRIFDIDPVVLKGRTEIGLPQTMLAASRKFKIPMTAVPVSFPLHFTTPQDIEDAERVLVRKK